MGDIVDRKCIKIPYQPIFPYLLLSASTGGNGGIAERGGCREPWGERLLAFTRSSFSQRTRAATRRSTRCSVRNGRGRQRSGMSRERLISALVPSQRRGKLLWPLRWLGQVGLRIFQAQTKVGPHGAREVRLIFPQPFLLMLLRLNPHCLTLALHRKAKA
jgi:hypothetical protein